MDKLDRQALSNGNLELLYAFLILLALFWFYRAIRRIERSLSEIKAKLGIGRDIKQEEH